LNFSTREIDKQPFHTNVLDLGARRSAFGQRRTNHLTWLTLLLISIGTRKSKATILQERVS
jgi:hypothetical protein